MHTDPMPVLYRLVPTGRTPHETREVLVTAACPSCGADWSARGSVRPHGSHRSFECVGCGVIHPARLVSDTNSVLETGKPAPE